MQTTCSFSFRIQDVDWHGTRLRLEEALRMRQVVTNVVCTSREPQTHGSDVRSEKSQPTGRRESSLYKAHAANMSLKKKRQAL